MASAILALIGTVSCNQHGPLPAAATSQPPSAAAARAELRALDAALETTADFRPFLEADLHSKVAGYLKRIAVDLGSPVREGETIAWIEAPELERERDQVEATERRIEIEARRARSEISRVEAELRIRTLSLDRLESVARTRPNLLAQQEIDIARGRVEESRAQLGAAQANLASAEQQIVISKAALERVVTLLGYTRIVAPFTGIVTKRFADPGAMIQQGTASSSQARPVVRMARLDQLRLTIPVPEAAVPGIYVGREVEIEVPVLGQKLRATVSRFTPTLDAATRTMMTEVDVPNPHLRLKPGMSAVVRFLSSNKPVLVVPQQAVLDRGGPTVLRVDQSGRLEERKVSLGVDVADRVEIRSGLEPGDIVLASGAAQFKPGQTVIPKLARDPAR